MPHQRPLFRHAAAPFWAAGIVLPLGPAQAQVQVTVDTGVRRQTIEGLGATATGTWNAQVVAIYADPLFADLLRDDLGLSMVRLEISPKIQPVEDLNTAVINPALFDFSPLQPAVTLAANMNQGHPGAVKIIGTVWSPPGWMKTNGSTVGGGTLRADRVPHFAKYLA